MILHALNLALMLFSVAMLLAGWRVLRGPEPQDRMLALDALYTLAMAIVVILGIRMQSRLYFEAALVIAMLGFVATAAAARFLSRGDIIQPN
jgi:multicomponent K+:H+ antiporter subunit F